MREVEKRLGPLAEIQALTKTTDERMTSLNALAEHVTQKVKALENQKHTVERAVVESNRLNEMIWNMEDQISKLNETVRQATSTEEIVERVEKVSREVTDQLDAQAKVRDGLTHDLARLEKDRDTLADFVRTNMDRLAVERKEFAAFDLRVKALQTTMTDAEKTMESLGARERAAASLAQRVDQLAQQMETINARARSSRPSRPSSTRFRNR